LFVKNKLLLLLPPSPPIDERFSHRRSFCGKAGRNRVRKWRDNFPLWCRRPRQMPFSARPFPIPIDNIHPRCCRFAPRPQCCPRINSRALQRSISRAGKRSRPLRDPARPSSRWVFRSPPACKLQVLGKNRRLAVVEPRLFVALGPQHRSKPSIARCFNFIAVPWSTFPEPVLFRLLSDPRFQLGLQASDARF